MEKVSLLTCKAYDPALLDTVIERHFQSLDPHDFLIKPGTKVLIKPNLLMRRTPDEATTTHPAFVAALVRAVKKRGGVVTIADSPGGPYTPAALRGIYAATGMADVAKKEGAVLNESTDAVERVNENGQRCHSFQIIRPIAEADVVISAAKLKTHAMTGFSGAVKNLFGSVPGLMKPEFHYRFPDKKDFGHMLVDLCETVKPTFAFIDGIVGMEGNGPSGGKPKAAGITGAALNPYALDLVMARIIGFSAAEVPTLSTAIERKLCPAEIGELEIIGERVETLLTPFEKPDSASLDFMEYIHMPAFLRKPLKKLMTPRPVIVRNKCIGCGKCAESCPRHVIQIEQKKAHIAYANCIHCFCCHEMCPVKAINIHTFKLFGSR
ncbi:MAG: DUF362 domain-containing protein [Ethanoligenens sp.]